jgi:hypothetical protein
MRRPWARQSDGTPFAGEYGMERQSLTRPPRSKRAPEVVRHVEETMDAYRRVADAAAKDKPAATDSRPAREADSR